MKKRGKKDKTIDEICLDAMKEEYNLYLNGIELNYEDGETKIIGQHNYFYLLSNNLWNDLNVAQKAHVARLFIESQFPDEQFVMYILENNNKITFNNNLLILDYNLLNYNQVKSYMILKNIYVNVLKSKETNVVEDMVLLREFLSKHYDYVMTLKSKILTDNYLKTSLERFDFNYASNVNKAFECLDNEFGKLFAYGQEDDKEQTYNEYFNYKKDYLDKINNIQNMLNSKLQLKKFNDIEKNILYLIIKNNILEKNDNKDFNF